MDKPTILFAGGGTGWHVMPIISLLHYIDQSSYHKRFSHIYWSWLKKSLEYKLLQEQEFSYISPIFLATFSGKWRRQKNIWAFLHNIRDIWRVCIAIFHSLYILKRYHIDIVFCKGWYIALPIIIAAAIYGKQIFVHESDVRAWITNKIAARFAHKIFTGFDKVFPKSITVGQILSHNMIISDQKIQELSISSNDKTHILVMGWSQGSNSINTTIKQLILTNPQIADKYFFHIIGGYANTKVDQLFKGIESVQTYGFVDQQTLAQLYYICDIAVTRAGTTSMAEQKLYNMLLWIIPIPWTHDQYDNAHRYKQHYGDCIIDQKDPSFANTLDLLLQQHIWYRKSLPNIDMIREQVRKTKQKILHDITQ